MTTLGIVVHGKAAADVALREAVDRLREEGHDVDVRVTWEAGDAEEFAEDFAHEPVDVVVAVGGDGTLNEVVEGVVASGETELAVGVVPHGTANDFAASCGIPFENPMEALTLAAIATPIAIDLGRVDGRHFVNVASGGFGAEVTAHTPDAMKAALGGTAYTLVGLVTLPNLLPYRCRIELPDGAVDDGDFLVIAVGNGRRAGAGLELAPHALLNDGLLDLLLIRDVGLADLATVRRELQQPADARNEFVAYRQLERFTLRSESPLPFSLDGERYEATDFEFEVQPGRIRMCFPPGLAMLAR